jgi:diguanylate cyclase (GGDEF)-like protein
LKNIYNNWHKIYHKIANTLNLQKILIVILFILFISLAWTYYIFINSAKQTFNNVKSSEIQNVKDLSIIIDKNLRYYLRQQHIIHKLSLEQVLSAASKNNELHKEFNDILSLYITKQVRYVYIIYKDKQGKYRYLFDGSLPESERGVFRQVFMPVNTELWRKCFKAKEDVYGAQINNVYGLWVTYLHPLIFKGKVQAVLAMDVSSKTYTKLEDILAPSRQYLKYMILFIFIIIFCIVAETFLLIREQKRRRVDILTGVYNRSYLKEMEKTLDLKKVAVAIVDIDFFKKVNDTYGHNYGDLVLRSVAKKLMLYSRSYDVVIRYGGEEFVVIFKNYDGYNSKKEIKNIVSVTKRLQRKISTNTIRLDNIEIKVAVSVGLDPFTYRRKSLSDSITMSDKALYVAKNTGRNKVVVARFNS